MRNNIRGYIGNGKNPIQEIQKPHCGKSYEEYIAPNEINFLDG
jgi:hypothetical protein